jgi:hypothetical protein
VRRLLLGFLRFYKKFISPILERVFGKACRFTPTCSEYTIEALEKFGAGKGLTLGLKRVLKCHPWGGDGWDPVPVLKKNKK